MRKQRGPSPRVRGAVSRSQTPLRVRGTIPAGAGSRLRDLGVYGAGPMVFTTFTESDKKDTASLASLS
ncbi:CRISPR-associated protein Cas3 [Streptomyces sp. F-3]|nr:CRISPR-associated protein Cas3 [Streptomyces sp. F-3]